MNSHSYIFAAFDEVGEFLFFVFLIFLKKMYSLEDLFWQLTLIQVFLFFLHSWEEFATYDFRICIQMKYISNFLNIIIVDDQLLSKERSHIVTFIVSSNQV